MTAVVQERSLTDVFIGEPLRIIKDQPHQVLLSTGSVAIMAQFAASSGIVDPNVGYAIAVGVEWAYLRGLASDSRARSGWGDALNWSAFGVVVLWGVLWCGKLFGVIAERPDGLMGWLLALAHVVPIAWLSLCSAMCHRTALAAEVQELARRQTAEEERQQRTQAAEEERKQKLQAERDAIALDAERKRTELAIWTEAQQAKASLPVMPAMPKNGIVPVKTGTVACQHCGRDLVFNSASEAGTIRRWGCPDCRAARKQK